MSSAIARGSTAGSAARSPAGSDSSERTSAAPAASTAVAVAPASATYEARARLSQEDAQLAGGEQRARRGQRQAGAQRAVHRHRETGSVGRHQRDDVAGPGAAREQAGGEALGAGHQLPVRDRLAARGVDHPDAPAPLLRPAERLLVQQPRRQVEVAVSVAPNSRMGHRRRASVVCRNPAHIYAGSLPFVKERPAP
jgi:hypothetical protein